MGCINCLKWFLSWQITRLIDLYMNFRWSVLCYTILYSIVSPTYEYKCTNFLLTEKKDENPICVMSPTYISIHIYNTILYLPSDNIYSKNKLLAWPLQYFRMTFLYCILYALPRDKTFYFMNFFFFFSMNSRSISIW